MPYHIVQTTGNMMDLEKRVNDFVAKDPGYRPKGAPYRYAGSDVWCQAMWKPEPVSLPDGEIQLREPKTNGKR